MIRLMFDSTTPEVIPDGAPMVAGYVNGGFTWKPSDWARFPGAVKLRIAVSADHALGDTLDVENGDATPEQAPAWIAARQKAGERYVTVYCSRDTLPAVEEACKGLNYYRWVATLDGTMTVAGHALATVQFAGANLAGRNVDVSVVWNGNWHPSPVPVPAWVPQAATDAEELASLLKQHVA